MAPQHAKAIRVSQQRPYSDAEFTERLLAEYAMLQSKADTIGSFRITIKGWSVAVLVGAAAASSKVDPETTLKLSGGLAVLLSIFFMLEFEQVRLSSLYLARAGRIERALLSVHSGRGEARAKRMPVPFTANELVFARRSAHYPPGDGWWSIAKRSHVFMYGLFIALAVLVGGRNWISLPHQMWASCGGHISLCFSDLMRSLVR